MDNLRHQVRALAKTFAPDERLDLPVRRAREAAQQARAELEAAKARLDQVARAHRPGTDTSTLDAARREVERAHEQVRIKLEQTVRATAHREAEFQRAALLAFERARPVIAELVEAMSELSEALRPLQEFGAQRDLSSTRALANYPAFKAGAEALAAMARH